MYEIIDKLVLFLSCTTLYLFQPDNGFVIIPVIISIVFSCLFLYFEDPKFKLAGILLFTLLCLFVPNYIIFLPLLLYDILHTRYQHSLLLVPFLFIYHIYDYSSLLISFTSVFTALSYLLKYKTDHLNSLHREYNELRDSSVQMSMLLEKKNQTLLKNQDNDINLATLNERNRISKEIHDNIGHLLSRSLLQVGALLTVSKDEVIRDGLTALKESLSGGMDQIRSSIHNMYDESIDLYLQIDLLVKGFTFCPASFEYDIKNTPPLQLKHSLIAITKESMANIISHSNATKVNIVLREHPGMYQLIIHDNGTLDKDTKDILIRAFEKQQFGDGMGLRNIIDRVKSFDGNINISCDNGFKLFISIPKKQEKRS
jgi:signal transduction histidine kinase